MNINKSCEMNKFLISRSESVKTEDLIPTPKGKDRDETKKLLMEEHARSVADHKLQQSILMNNIESTNISFNI